MNTQDELKIRDMEILFQPFHSRKLDTPTRIVLPAMTRGFSPGGAPTDEVAAYYQRRAKHEVGLIITEGTSRAPPLPPTIPIFSAARRSGAGKKCWKPSTRRIAR